MIAKRQFVAWTSTFVLSAALVASGELTWRGAKLDPDQLPEEMPAGAQDAVRFWRPWTADHDYRMDLSQDGRALLLTLDDSKGRKRAKKNLALVEDVLERMDAILAVQAPMAEASSGTAEAGAPGDGRPSPEVAAAVLVEMDALADHTAAVDFLVESHDYLNAWGAVARGLTGFVLERPLVAAWQPKAGLKEDWEGESTNEMVNRLAQLMTLRRVGRLPYWLSMGIAWHVEMEELDGVFCFPYRSGFVSSSEHGQWDRALRNEFKSRKEPLAMAELTKLQRGTFDLEAAQMAWGVVTFVTRYHPGALAAISADLQQTWDEKSRKTNADGTWTRITDFEPSDGDQLDAFERQVPGFLTELQAFFVKGKSYKAP